MEQVKTPNSQPPTPKALRADRPDAFWGLGVGSWKLTDSSGTFACALGRGIWPAISVRSTHAHVVPSYRRPRLRRFGAGARRAGRPAHAGLPGDRGGCAGVPGRGQPGAVEA